MSAFWNAGRQLARAGFRRESRYRLAALAGLFTNVVFGFIKSAVLLAAVNGNGGTMAGYTAGSIGAYVWISQGLLGAIPMHAQSEMGDRIRTGDIAIDFIRPFDVQAAQLATDLGRASFSLLPRGVPSVLVGALTVGLTLPSGALPYVLGAISITLGVTLAFLCQYAVNLVGFWIIETRGVRTVYSVLCTFLAGLYVPVALFPDWLRVLAQLTPFPSTLQAPVDILSGRVLGWDALQVVGVQLGWAVLICLLGRVLTNAGRHKLEVQGG